MADNCAATADVPPHRRFPVSLGALSWVAILQVVVRDYSTQQQLAYLRHIFNTSPVRAFLQPVLFVTSEQSYGVWLPRTSRESVIDDGLLTPLIAIHNCHEKYPTLNREVRTTCYTV
ncbi:uncharacterized protein LOC142317620 [Lycorma delicatula]|uniref:uncharacterized protein LOC142317620 n=1 Tax=Lycorma delicatula TaxID=130591 RepID=UPI003F51848C